MIPIPAQKAYDLSLNFWIKVTKENVQKFQLAPEVFFS
jgi:hypothetical protein